MQGLVKVFHLGLHRWPLPMRVYNYFLFGEEIFRGYLPPDGSSEGKLWREAYACG